MWGRYRDTIEWHEIAILTSPQGRVPVFRSGRLQRRELFVTVVIDFIERLFIALGLLKDVQRQAAEALALLEEKFDRRLA